MTTKFKRREFILQSLRGVLFSGIAPFGAIHLFPLVHSEVITASRFTDDLEKLKHSIQNRQKPLKWIFTGDSITQGAKHTLGYRAYPEIFSERVRFEMGRFRDFVINTAISGHTTREILSDFDWRVKQVTPDVVFLMIGTNDAANSRQISADEFGNNLKTLVKKIRVVDAIPVLQTPNIINMGRDPAKNERAALPEFTETMRQVAAGMNTILVDHWKYWEERKQTVFEEGWLNDALHPNGKGHLKMARLLFKTFDVCDEHSFTCAGKVTF